ncbi:hypothetical protein GCM10022393_10680 [Aquimarina addita]|uniref:Uncharacterized protein n=1 Tax=Aquimarina addita TaxID=870485 RepID=A0ABP7XEC8_9FLAO
MKKKNVVGFDIVELCPNKVDRSSDFAAAKLYYKMLSYKFRKQDVGDDNENLYTNEESNKPNHLKFDDHEYEG